MKVKEIRELTTDQIIAKIKETKEELFNLRFQQATGNLEKPSRIRELRHTVARLKTVLRERELNDK
ncbi:MAG TPA: 50S ribosomal protein L29 [Candidatus Faecenecus gallistercoris]|jgi:large subunit ribosomal protein L29|uniref:Large ribosomal subunit protein uL29 n=1 Tax=Candidatus Faecenecus gallistercoris TaxID=2840793 RepID=A0A9D0YYT9_9FIRM|nr:50S ribosomal protein L29 [Bacillota bacterium]MDY4050397.1 50S ribosomal protein L29 [Candidatus Faecenecus gallistercoris]CDE08421.1 50S ribosomal protein L29 [Bacillus sp. CAG:988]MDD7102796.1 50S ribosomal protein L29 [Bacillota bacterium]PWL69814.1 MAG: 50S ribosomal protein L29 [Bacillota bacterium]